MLVFRIRVFPSSSLKPLRFGSHRTLCFVSFFVAFFGLFLPLAPSPAAAQGLVVPARVIIEENSLAGALDRAAIEEKLEPLTGARLIYSPKGNPSCCAAEPYAQGERWFPLDPTRVGYQRASLIADSKWATIRYLGESPAGHGTNADEWNTLMRQGLGRPNDVLPVTTAVFTINEMMEHYFVPLLRSLPQGEAVMNNLHIDGAYFSPTLRFTGELEREFDNAFVAGLQSLLIYPSSCFQRANHELCREPFLSTGHDPTVIGHELGHAVFNQLLGQEGLKGFQWFAVNEGYADYFSAVFFRTAAIGQSWQSTRTRAPYLRRLSDHPTVRDPEVLKSAHNFGSVWSSLLWNVRKDLAQRFAHSEFEFDRAVLLSITHLGEGGGARLGDAARALLKATYELGFPQWDTVIRQEMETRKIQIVSEQLALVPKPRSPESSGFGCSSRDARQEITNRDTDPRTALRISQAGFDFSLTFLFGLLAIFLCSCVPWLRKEPQKKLSEQALLQKPFASYDCDLAALSGTSLDSKPAPVSLAFAGSAPQSKKSGQSIMRVFVFDPATDSAEHAVQVLVDRENLRVDRSFKVDGSPVKVSLGSDDIGTEAAVRLAYVNLATMVFESAPLAARSAQKLSKVSSVSNKATTVDPQPAAVSFAMGLQGTFQAVYPSLGAGAFAAAQDLEMPRQIGRADDIVCKRKD